MAGIDKRVEERNVKRRRFFDGLFLREEEFNLEQEYQVRMRRLHNRRQNEATEYGSAFARAMEVSLGDARYVFVSGTASIDDHGASVHLGDFEAQARYTLEAVEALLEGAGAGLGDVAQATAFLKNPGDGRSFERTAARAGLGATPLVTTVADVCPMMRASCLCA